jgi:amino acid transporter
MAYGELGTMLPFAGGEYSYYLAAFGGFSGFIYIWVSVIILKPAMMAIICLTFSYYAVNGFLPPCYCGDGIFKVVGALTIGNGLSHLFLPPLFVFTLLFILAFCTPFLRIHLLYCCGSSRGL